MPLYDYRCNDCGHVFEAIRPVAENTQAPPCPNCGSGNAALRITGFSGVTVSAGRFRAASPAQALAGAGVKGPGVTSPRSRNSVLHNCSGSNCRICGT